MKEEDSLQITVVRYIEMMYPQVLVASFPNEGKRSKVDGALMKAKGRKAGMPDLIVMFQPRIGEHDAFFIELKTDDGVLSKPQKDRIAQLDALGFRVYLARTLGDIEEIFGKEGLKPRFKVNLTNQPHLQ